MRQIGLTDLVVPTIKTASTINDLINYHLPGKCIIKPTHSSGQLIIVNETRGRTITKDELITLDRWLKEDYYIRGREPNYHGLEPRIIIEELLFDKSGNLPCDYKIFCVNGAPFLIQVDLGRFSEHTRQLYTPDWKLLPFSMCYPRFSDPIPRPEQLSRALEIASTLTHKFKICRADFYFIDNREIRVGELTFFPGNCAERFIPDTADFIVGNMISSLLSKN